MHVQVLVRDHAASVRRRDGVVLQKDEALKALEAGVIARLRVLLPRVGMGACVAGMS